MLVPKTHDSIKEFIAAAEEKIGRRLTDDEREVVGTVHYPHGDSAPCDDADLSEFIDGIRQTSRPNTYRTRDSLQAQLLNELPSRSLNESVEKVKVRYKGLLSPEKSYTLKQITDAFANYVIAMTDDAFESLSLSQQQGQLLMLSWLAAWPDLVSEIARISQVHDVPAWKVADLVLGAPQKWTKATKQNAVKVLDAIPAHGRARGWLKRERKTLTKGVQVKWFLRWAYGWEPGNPPPAIGWPPAWESYNDAMAANNLDHLKIPTWDAFRRLAYRLPKD